MSKISIIMPVYNTDEKYLRPAVESILNQTFKDFEFLIINDGSINNAEEVILSYQDERINYIKNEKNLGLIKTLNKGLNLANGEYIARMDSDDISLPERFERQIDFLEKNTNIGILGTWYEWFPKQRVMKSFTDSRDIKECLLLMNNALGHPTVMLRKSAIDKFKIRYDENALYVEDYALWLSLINKVEFANISEVLLKYRRHSGSICKKNKIKQNLNCQKIMFEAQGKYFEVESKTVLDIIEKLQNNKQISSNELLAINSFVNQIKDKKEEKGFKFEYKINRDFYKFAIKKCKKDLLFFKLLITGKLKHEPKKN